MLDLHVGLTGYTAVDFDVKRLRAGIRKEAAGVRKTARRLIARRAVSQPGQYSGKVTGLQQRSIKVRMARRSAGRPGLWAAIGPVKTEGMENFYPAILVAGVTGQARRKDHKTQPKTGKWRIAPRKNYMPDALKSREPEIRETMRDIMINSLVARK